MIEVKNDIHRDMMFPFFNISMNEFTNNSFDLNRISKELSNRICCNEF